MFQNGLGLTKTTNSNSPWAYIREGLLSEGCLRSSVKFFLLVWFHVEFPDSVAHLYRETRALLRRKKIVLLCQLRGPDNKEKVSTYAKKFPFQYLFQKQQISEISS